MKICATFGFLTIIGLIVSCNGLPARQRMVYYRQPQSWYATPQRLMYLQYQQVQPAKIHARSTQAAAALVAGDTVATGTYLKDCHNPEDAAPVEEDVLSDTDANSAQSVAEAYPAEPDLTSPDSNDNPTYTYNQPASNDEAAIENIIPAFDGQTPVRKVPKEYDFGKPAKPVSIPEADDAIAAAEIPAPDSAPETAVKTTVAPVVSVSVAPSKQYLPSKKKVYVELESDTEDEELEDDTSVDEYEPVPEVHPARVPNARKPPKSKAKGSNKAKAPLPAGTFFPIDFGGTSGGAIAIANSFSTGEGGSATSHATAYGSPEAARARFRTNKYH